MIANRSDESDSSSISAAIISSLEKLLAKIFSDQQTPLGVGVAKVIADYLREQQNPKKRNATTKRRKFNVIPGKSTAFQDSPKKSNSEDIVPSTSKTQTTKRRIFEKSKESLEAETNASKEMEYQTKKTIKHYVGKVIAINNEEANIKFLKRSKSGKFKWPNVEGEDTISINNIKKRLGVPKIGRNGTVLETARSPDLTPLNFLLWNFVENYIYRTPVNNREKLRHCIEGDFLLVTKNMLHTIKRASACAATSGSSFKHLL
ncbi:hypothetical protein ILUMI_25598 [Ignelater luminosus]|uniref:Uncharacterized protein n=1 Tax=Ignelater luminosus TaxID=2038154 RepID=A0A8K0FZW6_IGNLU|nr:hypothetical protein ILUMI_25598 [Ignelater luminosus]